MTARYDRKGVRDRKQGCCVSQRSPTGLAFVERLGIDSQHVQLAVDRDGVRVVSRLLRGAAFLPAAGGTARVDVVDIVAEGAVVGFAADDVYGGADDAAAGVPQVCWWFGEERAEEFVLLWRLRVAPLDYVPFVRETSLYAEVYGWIFHFPH